MAVPRRILSVPKFVEQLPKLTPVEFFDELATLGYRGQEHARRSVALVAYRHVRRLQRLHLESLDRTEMPPKPNTLLIGPTGCGKTYLVELLFRELLRLPTVIVDVTGFSETGYIGNDAVTILTQLLSRAGDNPLMAACGVVCLDEFDKLATSSNRARFDGEGSTKDVSGLGVQKELLRMMESGEIPVPMDQNNSAYSGKVSVRTDDITFIACGAFSGLSVLSRMRQRGQHLGFLSEPAALEHSDIAADLNQDDLVDTENFQAYGFLPELIGRFTRIVPLQPLDHNTLHEILRDNVIRQFTSEFESEGLKLRVSPRVLDRIVERAIKRQTGARGLNAILTELLEKTAFQVFGQKKGVVTVDEKKGALSVRVRAESRSRRPKRAPKTSK